MNWLKRFLDNTFWILMALAIIVTVLLGIWYDPFPFWKAFATEVIIITLYRFFFDN